MIPFTDLRDDEETSLQEMQNISCCGKTLPALEHGTPHRNGSFISVDCPVCGCRASAGWSKREDLDPVLLVEPCIHHQG